MAPVELEQFQAWKSEPSQGQEVWHVLRQQCGVAGGSDLVSDDIHGIGAPFVRESAVIEKKTLSKYCSVRSAWCSDPPENE
ncbi:hypothetical protein N7537_009629 [Penicillium hordei]|jgi:hypothetical protein|uniref:Uncharacterized protein n=1 Tax=Penicillium hordei TaxID=40994 RepID=A0AAD6GXC3_9EURO|nr:uncharacterized protein N7537_009629 [Penicillium hordei]KAJ5592725.1 hypothetical protein N7537_009629 [Penicillium hordei]